MITNINIECIILIINSLNFTEKTVNYSIYSRQTDFLTVYSVLRLFFPCSLNYKIKF